MINFSEKYVAGTVLTCWFLYPWTTKGQPVKYPFSVCCLQTKSPVCLIPFALCFILELDWWYFLGVYQYIALDDQNRIPNMASWKIHHLSRCISYEQHGDFHCYLSFPECNQDEDCKAPQGPVGWCIPIYLEAVVRSPILRLKPSKTRFFPSKGHLRVPGICICIYLYLYEPYIYHIYFGDPNFCRQLRQRKKLVFLHPLHPYQLIHFGDSHHPGWEKSLSPKPPPRKLTWQWKIPPFESMYFLLKLEIFQPVTLVFGGCKISHPVGVLSTLQKNHNDLELIPITSKLNFNHRSPKNLSHIKKKKHDNMTQPIKVLFSFNYLQNLFTPLHRA